MEQRSQKKVTIPVMGVIALIAATPDLPTKYPAIILSQRSMMYITAFVKIPDKSIERNFRSQNPFIIMKPASHDIIFRIRPGGFSGALMSKLFTQYQLIAPVTVNVFHLIYHIFYHIDAQSADLPFLA